jgi:hypothetical protein
MPHPSISYIYQAIGCQHILQHTLNDFAPPSVPALTPRGFVRWECIETLLSPEEHVPYLQAALSNFAIKHPDTGEPFPTDLPAEAFPTKTDPGIERWHRECSEKLRRQATPDENDRPNSRPTLPPRHKIRTGYSYLRNPASAAQLPREREQGADYFSSRPLRYKHVPVDSARPSASRNSTYRPYLSPNDGPPESSRIRRRSFPDNVYSPPPSANTSPASPEPVPARPRPEDHGRRHSHPRHRRSSSSSSSSSSSCSDPDHDASETSPTAGPSRKAQTSPKKPAANIRVSVPTPTPPMMGSYSNAPLRHHNLNVPNARDRGAPYKIPVDISGMRDVPPSQSKGRGGSVRRISRDEIPQHKRRASLNTTPKVEKDDSDGDDDSRRDRDRDRRRRIDGRPQLVHTRSGSHDGRYTSRDSDRDHRDGNRDRYSDRDEKEIDRRRERNSPPKGMDWKRYIPEILR